MTTHKPKIQGYITQDIFDRFTEELTAWDCSQSEALERILTERYQPDGVSNPPSESPYTSA